MKAHLVSTPSTGGLDEEKDVGRGMVSGYRRDSDVPTWDLQVPARHAILGGVRTSPAPNVLLRVDWPALKEAGWTGGLRLTATDQTGKTPLEWACAYRPEWVEPLLNAGADALRHCHSTPTALMQTVRGPHPESFERLMAAGVPPGQANRSGITPLMVAAEFGETWALDRLMGCGVDLDARDHDGNTALLRACGAPSGRVAVAALVKAGADAACLDRHGRTALISLIQQLQFGWNAMAGSDPVPVAEALVKAGCPVLHVSADGQHALGLAAGWNDERLFVLLAQEVPDWRVATHGLDSPWMTAAEHGADRVLRWMVPRQPDIDERDALGRTALIAAAWHGHLESVQILIEAGADPFLCDLDGRDALNPSIPPLVRHGQLDKVERLRAVILAERTRRELTNGLGESLEGRGRGRL
jgi:ankyrin repeat protein